MTGECPECGATDTERTETFCEGPALCGTFNCPHCGQAWHELI